MREELIINGQHCDLGEGTGITLEYVSNLLNEPGKISLSHSYTIKLPRTANNARILDLPELPAHESSMARRYLPVNYYRNGINLIGDNAHAYLTSATDEQYELVLIWDDIPELRTLSESEATINDLPDLPVLNWVGNSYGVDDNGALFAKYASSNAPKDTEAVNDLIHPCMRMYSLMERILDTVNVPYRYHTLQKDPHGRPVIVKPLYNVMVLAAPSHKPNEEMNKAAGLQLTNEEPNNKTSWWFEEIGMAFGRENYALNGIDYSNWVSGGGTTVGSSPLGDVVDSGGNTTLRGATSCQAILAFKFVDPPIDLTGKTCQVLAVIGGFPQRSMVLAEVPIIWEPAGFSCYARLSIQLPTGIDTFRLVILGLEPALERLYIAPYGYGNNAVLTLYTERERIETSIENEFPLGGNLPDLKQWDFIRNFLILSGRIPVPTRGTLVFWGVKDILNVTRAVDWTDKINAANTVTVRHNLGSSWAQRNLLKFAKNEDNTRDPGFLLDIADQTLNPERDWAALDFAASLDNTAIHYKSTDNGATYEDVDIEPRIFTFDDDTNSLNFTPDLYGEGLKAKYATLQAALEKPVIIEATARLTEIDLATLDLTRPVYLAQYGQYYHILKVQTSENDMCKVELLQLKSR